jgi:hypothetical protein
LARFPFSVCRPRRSFRPEAAGFRTIPLRRSSGRGTHAVDRLVLAVFNASRPIASLHQDFCDGSDAAAAGHSCPASFSVHVPGPRAAIIAAWPGGLVPATLVGFAHALRSIDPIHRQARLSFVSPPRAHVPFRLASTASFIVAGFTARSRQTMDVRPRLLGFDLKWISRAVRPADPAIAFTHRVAQIHQPGLPWASYSLFRVFTAGPRPSLLKTLRPWALARRSRRLCIADRSSASRSSRVPFGVLTSSGRLAAAVVFPSAGAFPYEVFAPAAKRPPARAGALGSWRIFLKDAAQASLDG